MVCDEKSKLGSLQGNDGSYVPCDQHSTNFGFLQSEHFLSCSSMLYADRRARTAVNGCVCVNST